MSEDHKKEEVKDADLISFCNPYIGSFFKENLAQLYNEGSCFVHFSKSHVDTLGRDVTKDQKSGKRNHSINLEKENVSEKDWEKLLIFVQSILNAYSQILTDGPSSS